MASTLLLALETISAETTISIGLLVSLLVIGIGSFGTALVSRTRTTAAVEQMRADLAELKHQLRTEAQSKQAQLDEDERRLRSLEEWRIRCDAVDEAVTKASSSTARGTRPYTR